MNKLSSGQMIVVLVTFSAFTFLCQTAALTIEGIFGAAIAAAVQILLSIPMLVLYRRGFSFSAYAKRHRLLPLCFVGYLLLRGGVSFVRLQRTTTDLALPVSGKFLAAALIALVCIYTASLGIQALARSSSLIFGILLFTLLVMLLGAIPLAEPQNLFLSQDDTIWYGFLRSMHTADELPLLFLLLDFTEQKKFRSAVSIFTGKFALLAFVSLLGMAVLGNRMTQADHPFFSIASISQPLSTQRADALYLVVFVMLCVLRITLFTVLTAHLLRLSFPKIRYSSTVCLALMLAVAAAAASFTISTLWNTILLLLLALLVPLGFLFASKRGGTAA